MDNINKIINKLTTKQITKSLSNQSDGNLRANLIASILMGYRPPVNQGIDLKIIWTQLYKRVCNHLL